MHYRTKQLHRSQFVTQELKGENRIEFTLFEKSEAKVCRSISTLSRADRARLMALIQEGFKAVREGQDPEAVAALIRSEVSYECRS